ncbi:MAG: sigma 54-interacting transcriptional regulator [Acidobacteriota bacterium]|nr:sigma 54-interacting transcriptional regulator [Acidobacteriota bacterium]MDQ3420844.1 sigma 54-interacting transcriptional regulator [Acidobacteriota bacterium]
MHATDVLSVDPIDPATTLLAAITSGLSVVREPRLVRARFEEELRTLVNARSVAVRDCAPDSVRRPDVISFDVPAAPWTVPARLEAVFESTRVVTESQLRTLSFGAQIASLLVQIECASGGGARLRRDDGAAPLIGSSTAIHAVRERIERVAMTDFTILIEGESGTGKELVARQIHDLSGRRKGPFVAVNCAAIVETLIEAELFGIEDRTATGVRGRRGKFESAHGGTLFLDEIADLSPAAQAKLLRAIQDLIVERVGGSAPRRIDTRIIVATNRPLSEMVDRGRFRLDLFYRLNGIDVQVPPLRLRRSDILELASYFLERYRTVRPLKLSIAASDALQAYGWPGNVRELERVIERAVALATTDSIGLEDLPPSMLAGHGDALLTAARDNDSMRACGSRYARLVLERCANNKRRACRELGISYHTLQGYLKFRPEKARPQKARP